MEQRVSVHASSFCDVSTNYDSDRNGSILKENRINVAIVNDSCPQSITERIQRYTKLSKVMQESQSTTTEKGIISYRKWFVLIACFLKIFIGAGFTFYMSVLNVEFLKEFDESVAQTALVQSVIIGTYFIAGTVCGPFESRFGARITDILGGVLASLGLGISYFATGIPFLVTSVGVVTGVGVSASYVTSVTSIGEYFDGRSKLMALSFVTCGAGCGGMVYPFLLDYFIRLFGWRGCLLGVGGIMALVIPFSVICKPRTVGISENNAKIDHTTTFDQTESMETDLNPRGKKHLYIILRSVKTLTRNKIYIIFVFAISCTVSSLNTILIFAFDYLEAKGFDTPASLMLFFGLNISATIGMLLPGFGKYIPHLSVFIISAVFTIIGSFATAFLPIATTYVQHAVVFACFGISLGANVTTISMTTLKLVGIDNYPIGMGVVMTIIGISNVCAGPLSGLLRDSTGSYSASSYGVSIGTGVAAVLFVVSAIFRNYDRKKIGSYDVEEQNVISIVSTNEENIIT